MMKKMTMDVADSMTFEEACEKYLENCRERNLRQGSINHYRQKYYKDKRSPKYNQ